MTQATPIRKAGKIQVTQRTKATQTMQLILWSLVLFTLIGPFLLNYEVIDVRAAVSMTLENLQMMFLQETL